MADLDPVYQELAQRAVIPDIADPETILVKVDSPGRLYEPRALSDIAGGGSEVFEAETFTLTDTDIANKYVTLSSTPLDTSEIEFNIRNAPYQYYGNDFKQDEMYQKRITWELLNLDGVLQVGDKITISYMRGI